MWIKNDFILKQNELLLKIIEKRFRMLLETHNSEFFIEESDFYKIGKKIKASSTDMLDEIKNELKKKDFIVVTEQKNHAKEILSLKAEFNQFKEQFIFTLLPTNSEICYLNDRETLRQQLFKKELTFRILNLTPRESVTLINDVLGFDELPWIKNFKKGKLTRDGGIDFTAEICVDETNSINYQGFGKFFEVYGQLKHLQGKMSNSAIRDLIGTMAKSYSKIHFGMAISSRGFSDDCQKVIIDSVSTKSNKIKAIFCEDIHFISELMIKHKIGLKPKKIKSGLFVDEEWWDEIKFTT